MSLLEASYVICKLQPYHANIRKRLTKAPKLYFYDTGLLCHLLGIATLDHLVESAMRGAVFENLIIGETLKRHYNDGKPPQLFFYRDDSKIEVDLVDCTFADRPELVEIKSNKGFQVKFTRHLTAVGESLGILQENRYVVTRGDETFRASEAKIWSAHDWLLRHE